MNDNNKKNHLNSFYRLIQTPRAILTLAAVLLVVFVTGVIYELGSSKNNAVMIMSKTASTLAEIIAYSGEKSTIAMKRIEKELMENLKIKLRLLGELCNSGNLTPEIANEYAEATKLRVIEIDGSGKVVIASILDEPVLTNKTEFLQKVNKLAAGSTNEIITFELRNLTPNSKYRKGLALKLLNKKTILLIPQENAFNFRYSVGIGAMIKKFSAFPEIKYIIWQDDKGIVAAAGDYKKFINHSPDGKEIIEFKGAITYEIEKVKHGVFRIGMSAENIREIEHEGIIRVAVIVFVVLALSFILIKLTATRRRYEMERIKNEHFVSMGKLAAGVAHEVRNPLNVVGLSLQQLLSDEKMMDEQPENKMLITTACAEIKRADKTLHDFLKYAKPPKINKKLTNVFSLFDKVRGVVQQKAREQNISIKINCDKNLNVMIDPELFHQVIFNIALNAIDAMPEGGKLKFFASGYKNELIIIVSDTGTGITPNDREHIFELYYTTKQKGIGLGLPFVHRIVSMHDGRITVTDNKPHGTCIKIKL